MVLRQMMWRWTWQFTAGLDHLRGHFQPWRFYGSVIPRQERVEKVRVLRLERSGGREARSQAGGSIRSPRAPGRALRSAASARAGREVVSLSDVLLQILIAAVQSSGSLAGEVVYRDVKVFCGRKPMPHLWGSTGRLRAGC